MATKARYVGPFEEVTIWWPPGATVPEKTWVVKNNSFLPTDAPAALRDELTQSDDWRAETVNRSRAKRRKASSTASAATAPAPADTSDANAAKEGDA